MINKDILLGNVDLTAFYGINNANFDFLKKHFIKLNLVARDNIIKVSGQNSEIVEFESIVNKILIHIDKNNTISKSNINTLIASGDYHHTDQANNLILRGDKGLIIKARTKNQQKMVDGIEENDLIFAIGPAGSGKTYTAVALAVKALKNKEVKKIILTRPAVEAGENLGFLPGDIKEKLDPYLRPLYDALRDMIPSLKLNKYLEDNVIEIAPLAYMRGRTLNHAFVILDEAQNATSNQLKMFLTRMGETSKFIVTGDITQIDLPPSQKSGLAHAPKIMKNIDGLLFVYMTSEDIIRHKLVSKIVEAYGK